MPLASRDMAGLAAAESPFTELLREMPGDAVLARELLGGDLRRGG